MKDVIDVDSDNGSPVECSNIMEAERVLRIVNDLKQLNPKHKDDIIKIYKL